MQSLWNDQDARAFADSALDMRVYTSRLLGREDALVLHGGGNTSVKTVVRNLLGDDEPILYVKGSGWDLKTIEAAGFAPARLNTLQRLAELPVLSDSDMMRELKAACTDPAAPAPSVEAILHAIIPSRYVDHTHANAVVALSNTPDGEQHLRKLYGDNVLILPYVMPGFVLAQQVLEATRQVDWSTLKGIVLLHHGIFSFHDDARTSYENMLTLVTQAENYLRDHQALTLAQGHYSATPDDRVQLAEMRRAVSTLAGMPMLARWQHDVEAVGYAALPDVASLATRGPVTPDHTLHTKRTAAIVDTSVLDDIAQFASEYRAYFARHADQHHTCLDAAPRVAVWRNKGCVAFAPSQQRLGIVADIAAHTRQAVQWAEKLGGWTALPERDIFALEYWELEQAKLKRLSARAAFEGRVVVVTGAASGIGQACVHAFVSQGACVAALDVNPSITQLFTHSNVMGAVCDVTDTASVQTAIAATVESFGGIDILISNAGNFPPSAALATLSDEALQQCMALNLASHQRVLRECMPFLTLGLDAAVVIMASKNVPAPGPGAGAYSIAKAGLTQLARVAALELGSSGVRVNVLHPNAVFDTAVWSDAVLQQRATHYGMSVENYRKNNVLRTEITSADVARLAVTVAGPAFAKTTGAQIPIDGGNDRVI